MATSVPPYQVRHAATAPFLGILVTNTVASNASWAIVTTKSAAKAAVAKPVMVSPTPTISIFGEAFSLEKDDGTIYLSHGQWSLVGSGKTLVAAYNDLLSEMRDLARAMADDAPQILSSQAQRMRNFAQNAL